MEGGEYSPGVEVNERKGKKRGGLSKTAKDSD